MIKEIQLKNFKAFGEAEVTATFAPITLICGQNSAGKSSLIQSLLMLAQTMQSGDSNSESSDLVTNGKYIDLGNFNSLINNHDATKKLGVTIKFLKIRRDSVNLKSYEKDEFIPKISLIFETLNQKIKAEEANNPYLTKIKIERISGEKENYSTELNLIRKIFNNESDGSNIEQIGRVFNFEKETNLKGLLRELPISNGEAREYHRMRVLQLRRKQLSEEKAGNNEMAIKYLKELDELAKDFRIEDIAEMYSKHSGEIHYKTNEKILNTDLRGIGRFQSRFGSGENYLPSYFQTDIDGDISLAEIYLGRIRKFIDLNNTILSNTFRKFAYLGPLRTAPKRSYVYKSGRTQSVGTTGEDMVSILRTEIKTKDGKKILIEELLNDECVKLEIPYKFRTSLKSDAVAGDLIILNVTDTRTNTTVALTDVGFGISQILPIIVQGIYSQYMSQGRGSSILLVEQPELHLHPNLQAKLGDFIIEKSISSKSDTIDPNSSVQWIIETHSEALIRRIQRRIKEGQITPSDVSILYVDRISEKGSFIKKIRLDESGDFIDSWPNGFFVDAFNDLFQ